MGFTSTKRVVVTLSLSCPTYSPGGAEWRSSRLWNVICRRRFVSNGLFPFLEPVGRMKSPLPASFSSLRIEPAEAVLFSRNAHGHIDLGLRIDGENGFVEQKTVLHLTRSFFSSIGAAARPAPRHAWSARFQRDESGTTGALPRLRQSRHGPQPVRRLTLTIHHRLFIQRPRRIIPMPGPALTGRHA